METKTDFSIENPARKTSERFLRTIASSVKHLLFIMDNYIKFSDSARVQIVLLYGNNNLFEIDHWLYCELEDGIPDLMNSVKGSIDFNFLHENGKFKFSDFNLIVNIETSEPINFVPNNYIRSDYDDMFNIKNKFTLAVDYYHQVDFEVEVRAYQDKGVTYV
jgi:hypothetical protein